MHTQAPIRESIIRFELALLIMHMIISLSPLSQFSPAALSTSDWKRVTIFDLQAATGHPHMDSKVITFSKLKFEVVVGKKVSF